jgi:hypothetical protein
MYKKVTGEVHVELPSYWGLNNHAPVSQVIKNKSKTKNVASVHPFAYIRIYSIPRQWTDCAVESGHYDCAEQVDAELSTVERHSWTSCITHTERTIELEKYRRIECIQQQEIVNWNKITTCNRQ